MRGAINLPPAGTLVLAARSVVASRAMRMSWMATLLAITASSAAWAEGPQKYTMEDLRALAEAQSWSELLEHAEDVRPSERKAEWRGFLEKAAAGHLDALHGQKRSAEAAGAADQLLIRFPALKQSKVFMAKRRDTGLPAFAECMRDAYGAGACVERLDVFTKVDPADGELQLAAAKIVARGGMWAAAAPFFARAFDDAKLRKAGCRDDALPETLRRAFGQPPDYDNTKAAAKVAFEQCFDALEPVLMEAFYASGGYDAKNLCAGLVKKKKAKLTAFQQAFCKDQEG